MRYTMNAFRSGWASLVAVACGAVVSAALVAGTPDTGVTYSDPNSPTFDVASFQDALDVAMLKCALGRPDCVGVTSSSSGNVEVTTDGKVYSMRIQVGGLPPIFADKITTKAMQRFQSNMAFANALSPGTVMDPNQAYAVSDHTILDPNQQGVTGSMRITASLSMKVRTEDGRKGVLTVNASPSFAVRWSLDLK